MTNLGVPEGPAKKVRRQLSGKERLLVQKWLLQNWDMLAKEKFKVNQLCERVSGETGVPQVTPHGLLRLCKDSDLDILAITVVSRRGGRGPGKSPNDNHHSAVRKIATQLANLQSLVKDLCARLGEPFDPDNTLRTNWLRAYAGGKAKPSDYHTMD